MVKYDHFATLIEACDHCAARQFDVVLRKNWLLWRLIGEAWCIIANRENARGRICDQTKIAGFVATDKQQTTAKYACKPLIRA
jgi:hypothetical protein